MIKILHDKALLQLMNYYYYTFFCKNKDSMHEKTQISPKAKRVLSMTGGSDDNVSISV